jgi:hypothetical protein
MIILTIPLHLMIIFQDVKYREISTINLLFLTIIAIVTKLIDQSSVSWPGIFLNEFLIILQLYLMVFFIKLTKGVDEKVLDVYFGKGDVYLLMILGLCLDTPLLFKYYFTALAVSIIGFMVWKILFRRSVTIPFAAVLSAVFLSLQFDTIFTMLNEMFT